MVGVKHAIGVGNGTDAIFLAMKALGLKHGHHHEVITTPYSFYATPAMIYHAGGLPVFADVREDFNIDPDKIEAAITARTVGIVPVHWAGRPCAMDDILDIARRHGLWVMEDCAHAPASEYHGRKCGSFGSLATFSLHPLKNVKVWGDGGVVVTNDDAKAETVRRLRNHGMTDRNNCEQWGWNSRLDTIQAAVARRVLKDVYKTATKRSNNAWFLNTELENIEGIELVGHDSGTRPNFYLYSFHCKRRDELQVYLVSHGIDAKVHYPVPLHLQPAAKSIGTFKRGDFPMTEWCADSTLSLPVHDWITGDQLLYMVNMIKAFYASSHAGG